MFRNNNLPFNPLFQDKLYTNYGTEEKKTSGALPSFNAKINAEPVKIESTEVFDKAKFQELYNEGGLDKVIEYLDKCGKTYFIEQFVDGRTKVKVDNFIFTLVPKPQGVENTEETKEKSADELVSEKIDVWVNDLKKITSVTTLQETLKDSTTTSTTTTSEEKTTESTTTTTTATTITTIDYSFVLRKITYVSGHLPDSAKGKSFDPRISAYYGDNNVIGDNSDGDKIFNDLLNDIKDAILDVKGEDYIKNTIGEANFDALFKAAWVRTVESMKQVPVNSEEFAKNVLAKFEEILKNLQAHPENMSLFTDTSVNTQNLAGYRRHGFHKTTVNCKDYKQYDTGEYHLDDDKSDKQFQQTMQELLNRIYEKYPNVDKSILKDLFNKAQGEALDAVSGKTQIYPMTYYSAGSSTDSIRVDTLVDIVMYKFHNLLAEQVLKDGSLKTRTETTPTSNTTPKSTQTDAQNEAYKTGASGVKEFINKSYVKNQVITNCKTANEQNANFHTEFGIDSNGNIVFQESSTTEVYKQLKETLKGLIDISASSDALKKLGEANFDKLVQAAWIMTYNDYYSSEENTNLEKFINDVMNNLSKILDKISSKPELMEVYTKHTSYADPTLTNGLKHYGTNTTKGNDERIYHKGDPTVHADGTVHISDTDDDNDYQTTMNALLERVIAKYPSIDSSVITKVFRKAQEESLKVLNNGDIRDYPYGTNASDARVEDVKKDFYKDKDSKHPDSRWGDDWYIDMDQLVQFTLYYFDKLLLQELTE